MTGCGVFLVSYLPVKAREIWKKNSIEATPRAPAEDSGNLPSVSCCMGVNSVVICQLQSWTKLLFSFQVFFFEKSKEPTEKKKLI